MIYLDWGKYQQKPRQWGPLSAVRSAVFRNAERLGIDPAKIAQILIVWEGAGTQTGLFELTDFVGNPLWTPRGVNFNQTAGSTTGNALRWQNQIGTITEGTVIVDADIKNISAQQFLFTHNDFEASRRAYLGVATGGVYLRFGSQGGSTIGSVAAGKQSIACEWANNSARAYVNGQQTGTEYTFSGTPGSDATYTQWGCFDHPSFAPASGFSGDIFCGTVLRECNPTAIESLAETPYALLMPVSRPFIFDMAVGGSTETPGIASIGITGLDPIIDTTEIPNIDALTITGQDVTEVTSSSEVPENASVVVTGLDVNTLISITESPGEVAMTLAGQDVNTAILITEQVLNAALTLVGNDIILAESVIVGGATITINGRQVTVTGDEIISIIRQSGLSIGIRIGI